MVLFSIGCAHAPPGPALTRNLELEALEIAVRFDNPTPVVVMNLANQYLATGRNRDGHAYFCKRARQIPKRALFTALCGMFQARTAAEVPLLRRVAWVEDALAKLDHAASQDGLSRYLRGVVCAGLPPRFERGRVAEADLEWVLQHASVFPPGLLRGARHALRVARGEAESAAPVFVTNFSVVLLTHAHWDHVGGLTSLTAGGAKVIAQAEFASELARAAAAPVPFRYFFGEHTPAKLDARPEHLVAAPESLVVGGTRFELYPAQGGETEDALIIHLPERGVTFVGNAFMPYFGAPFLAEGSVEGLLDTIGLVRSLHPKLLLHGHAPLTENFPIAVLPGLEAAIRTLHDNTLRGLRAGLPLADALGRNLVPASLAAHPQAVLPFVLMRENLVKRVYQQRTGYWQTDGEGIEVFSRADQATALDLVAGGSADALVGAVATLAERGDFALALRVADLALARHPSHPELLAARSRILTGLRLKNQFNPFKFIVYSELAGEELSPPRSTAPAAR